MRAPVSKYSTPSIFTSFKLLPFSESFIATWSARVRASLSIASATFARVSMRRKRRRYSDSFILKLVSRTFRKASLLRSMPPTVWCERKSSSISESSIIILLSRASFSA